ATPSRSPTGSSALGRATRRNQVAPRGPTCDGARAGTLGYPASGGAAVVGSGPLARASRRHARALRLGAVCRGERKRPMSRFGACFALLLFRAGTTSAVAQGYPAKPIRVVVAYPAGGAADLIVRAVFNRLESDGYHTIVENRAGGGTQIAAEAAAKSPADG